VRLSGGAGAYRILVDEHAGYSGDVVVANAAAASRQRLRVDCVVDCAEIEIKVGELQMMARLSGAAEWTGASSADPNRNRPLNGWRHHTRVMV
jgi:hypothetical protein